MTERMGAKQRTLNKPLQQISRKTGRVQELENEVARLLLLVGEQEKELEANQELQGAAQSVIARLRARLQSLQSADKSPRPSVILAHRPDRESIVFTVQDCHGLEIARCTADRDRVCLGLSTLTDSSTPSHMTVAILQAPPRASAQPLGNPCGEISVPAQPVERPVQGHPELLASTRRTQLEIERDPTDLDMNSFSLLMRDVESRRELGRLDLTRDEIEQGMNEATGESEPILLGIFDRLSSRPNPVSQYAAVYAPSPADPVPAADVSFPLQSATFVQPNQPEALTVRRHYDGNLSFDLETEINGRLYRRGIMVPEGDWRMATSQQDGFVQLGIFGALPNAVAVSPAPAMPLVTGVDLASAPDRSGAWFRPAGAQRGVLDAAAIVRLPTVDSIVGRLQTVMQALNHLPIRHRIPMIEAESPQPERGLPFEVRWGAPREGACLSITVGEAPLLMIELSPDLLHRQPAGYRHVGFEEHSAGMLVVAWQPRASPSSPPILELVIEHTRRTADDRQTDSAQVLVCMDAPEPRIVASGRLHSPLAR